MTEYSHELKIPRERVAVLIGKGGETKDELEQATKTRINVDSEEGEVIITGTDPILLFSAREIVKAVARGFNPDVAIQLLKPEYCFEIVNIMDYAKTKKDSIRLKGRVIGSDGKARRIIEEMCGVQISVYGKTIGIIGELQFVTVARRAIESLLSGSPHSNVYRWLEKQRRDITRANILGTVPIGGEDGEAEDADE